LLVTNIGGASYHMEEMQVIGVSGLIVTKGRARNRRSRLKQKQALGPQCKGPGQVP
jgi:hypothetical protein